MKLSKIMVTMGIIFLVMEFSTIFLFNYMLTISKDQGLRIEQLAEVQMMFMHIVLISLVLTGSLFFVLMIVWVWRLSKLSKTDSVFM